MVTCVQWSSHRLNEMRKQICDKNPQILYHQVTDMEATHEHAGMHNNNAQHGKME